MTRVTTNAPVFDLTTENDGRSARARRPGWWPFLGWTAGVGIYAAVLRAQLGLPLMFAAPTAIVYFSTLALLMIPVSRASVRLAERRPTPALLVASHAAIACVVITIWCGINIAVLRLAIGPGMWQEVFAGSWMFQLMGAVFVYSAALGLMLTVQAHARERQRDRREAELLIVARDAELATIKAQLHPHFVLNALNSVVALIDTDPALARTMAIRLADLMKAVFDRFDAVQVPLERELDLIRAYLDVERIRFGARLTVTIDVDEASARAAVPAFLLQPIVENAVKHGIAPHAKPGQIRISARTVNGRVTIAVCDSGTAPQGADFASSSNAGRGLELTRRRLDAAYGNRYRLSFDRDDAPSGGLAVRLDLPAEAGRAE